MKYRVAINGYGRIGRSILRAFYERPALYDLIDIIAINEPADIRTMAYLTRYDSTHGRFPAEVSFDNDQLIVAGKPIIISHSETPEALNWQHENIDLLLECSGSFKSRKVAECYLQAGPKRLLFSQPAESSVDKTVVYGVNHSLLSAEDRIVSNGSCTTNCIVPVLKALHKEFGIEEGVTTTIHSSMNDQPVIDAYHHTNLRLTRAVMQAVIPVETELNKGIERILPELTGRFKSIAIRVPTVNVSLIDLTIRLSMSVTQSAVNKLFSHLANDLALSSIMGYSDEPHASVDFNHDSRSVIVDGSQTQVCNGSTVKLLCWFDNEWGFANRMLDMTVLFSQLE